jgi:peptidoglycan/xylan/chitin deacetylase (PgdA/CDA1 family)
MDGADCDAAMDALRLRLGNGEPPVALDRDMAPMDWKMVRSLAAQGGGIGAHARSLTPLNIMSANDQRQEIFGSRDDLASSLGPVPTGFAYPYGQYDAVARNLVEEAGFGWAVTTNGQIIHPRRHDRHALPRITVQNWNGQEFARALRKCGA